MRSRGGPCHPEADGLHVDAASVHALNAVHEGVTLALGPPDAWVAAGELVATVKVMGGS